MAMYGNIFSEINAKRSIPLIRDPTLDNLAKAHSKWMSERRVCCHEGVETRYVQMAQRGYTAKAENVACHQGLGVEAAVVQGWINSPEHYKNLSNPAYTHTGIGIVGGIGGTRTYVTQIFGTSSDPILKKRLQRRRSQQQCASSTRSISTRSVSNTVMTAAGHTSSRSFNSNGNSSSIADHADAILHGVLLRDEQKQERPEVLLMDYKRAGELYMEAIRRSTASSEKTREWKRRLQMVVERAEQLKEPKHHNNESLPTVWAEVILPQ
mmetsp:Transcript_20088/g.29810  ORF Transcript_20088/g.29810 Transcript_20088/m.29810 type:complete len:267 (-) Transcript_20088:81-881(-)|eukprot:CAMPEP_0194205686 /NCGR_PEP_ID=MMETSP0156-20130528/4910_1 /TAXON_ID=33649 /ORGANISM="Thalassionema nitzschioides, Strain L26-B" /LENGTH=266 /DNA_ID=CAMNT_0038932033 /DNA_START=27 /DNA_END=827 /DNA_ORIENTATION=-